MNSNVNALAVSGTDLYAGGSFTTAGGGSARCIAKWNGSAWSALGSGVNSSVNALAADASGHLFVGGDFLLAGTTVSPFIARANLPLITPLENWRQLYFGTTSNTGNAADTFDFDKDGLKNIVEFAFGLNPTLGSSVQLPQGQQIGNNFVITFPTPAGVSGITYGAEWSTTVAPGSWTAIPDTGAAPQHTLSVPISDTKLFVRLKVTSP